MRLEMAGVGLGYGRKSVLSGINGVLEPGQTVALTGCNGSGKSTLLRTLAGHQKPAAGSIIRTGLSKADLGYLPQSASLNRDVPVSVFDYAASGLFVRTGPFAGLSRDHRNAVASALNRLGLEGLEQALINEISGGQFQRAAFARVLLQEPKLILLDEPFAALDAGISEELMGVIADWRAAGRCVVAALHHGAMIPRFSRQLSLDHGRPAWIGEEQVSGGSAGRLRLVSGETAVP